MSFHLEFYDEKLFLLLGNEKFIGQIQSPTTSPHGFMTNFIKFSSKQQQ